VTPALQTALVALAAVVVLLSLVAVLRDREPDWWLAGALGVVEVLLIVQCVVGLVQLAGTDRDVSGPTFTAYLVGSVLVPPAAFVWAATERTRWGTAVIAVGGLAVIALVFRLEQIWGG
jgi:hypothetical protein